MEVQADLFQPQAPAAEYPFGIPEKVCRLFEHFALEIIGRGYERYSSDAILHRIRWHEQIDRGNREFKCNDHWTAPLARWFIARHPDHKTFFALRESQHD